MPVRYDESTRRVIVETNHNWCLGCEEKCRVLLEGGSPHTPESAQRATLCLRTLERTLFEEFYTAHICSETPHSKALRVPVLYLRRLFLEEEVYLDNEVSWGARCDETPQWLAKLRHEVDKELRDARIMDAVFAPFDETLVFVDRHPRVAARFVFDRREQLCERYYIDVPSQMTAENIDTHRLYTAVLLRVCVTYTLLDKCNGYAWSFDHYDCAVPYRTNEPLQKTCLMLQLFADTHLDLCAALHAVGSLRYDDIFLSSASVHTQQNNQANSFAYSGSVPLGARLSFFERFYPHPLRAPWAGEIASLEGTPLSSGNVWNVQTTQGGGSGGGNANTSGSTGNTNGGSRDKTGKTASQRARGAAGGASRLASERHNEDDFLDSMVHLFLSKPLNYPSMRRNYANMATRNMHNFPALFEIQLASMFVSALGNYPGPRFRPLWRARVVVTRAHHFSTVRFEPAWCASCGTEKMKSASKMNISRNACPRCEPAERALWCTARCMRPMFMAAATAERAVDEDGGAGQQRLIDSQKISSASFFKYSATMRSIQRKIDEEAKVDRATVDRYFEQCRVDKEFAGSCDLCEASQRRLEERGLPPMDDEELRLHHHTAKHLCPYCRKREHDDAQKVHEQRVKQGRSAKIGSKTLCSRHMCAACELIGRNEMYSFYVAKECYAFRLDSEGCTVHTLAETNNWRTYRRLLFEAMDEVRRCFNQEYSLKPAEGSDTLCDVPPAGIGYSLSRRIRELVNYNHRYIKKTHIKFKKESFVSVMRKKLKTVFSDVCVQNTYTRTQRPEDFLDTPDLVLEIGRIREAEARRKYSNRPNKRALELALLSNEEQTKRAYEALRRWREDYGYCSKDVHAVAQRAAAQFLECQTSLMDGDRASISPTAAVNLRSLRHVGVDEASLKMIEEMAFNYEVLCAPDNPLAAQMSELESMNRADFCVLFVFCTEFSRRAAFRIYPLCTTAARMQVHALRQKAHLLPHEHTPADLGVRHVCSDCSQWYTDIVPPTNFSELSDIVLEHDGDPMASHLHGNRGSARHCDHDDDEAGDGVDGDAPKKKRKKKRRNRKNQNALLDLEMMELVCPQNANSTALKRMQKAGELERDLVFEPTKEQKKKANSIRNARERGNECGSRPLLKISMIGVAVCVANEGQNGNVYALCGFCGNMFCMAEGKPMPGGVPDCGRHTRIGGTATRPYTALHAYAPPVLHPERRGANNVLRVAHLAPEDAVPYTSTALTRSELSRSIRLLNDYEYAPPTKRYIEALGVPSLAHAASRGWVRCTATIAQPKVPVERSASNILAVSFPRFDSQTVLCTGTVPSSVPTLTEAESRRGVASDWMRYESAKGRIRREETAMNESRKESMQDFCDLFKIQLRHVEVVSNFLMRKRDAGVSEVDEDVFLAYCAENGMKKREDVVRILDYLDREQLSQQSLTRRKARTESLSGFVVPELIEVRERCMSLLSSSYGQDTSQTAVVCAYCGTAADSNSCYVRVDALDPDGLCRNRYTAAPLRGCAHSRFSETAARVQVFFCETHFGKLQPLLAHYALPTTAMMFVFILYATRDALEQKMQQMSGKVLKSSKRVKFDMADQYDDFYNKRSKRKPRKSAAERVTPRRETRKRTKRSRVATIPNTRVTKNTRPGRKRNVALPKMLGEVLSNLKARRDGIDLKKIVDGVKNKKNKEKEGVGED